LKKIKMSKNIKKNTKGVQSGQTNQKESTEQQTKKNITLLINGEASLKFLLAKNPYDLQNHEKNVQKFADASLHLYNVKVFFPGTFRSHQDILEFKYKILNEHHKAREPNSKKLCSESNTLASLLLKKHGIETLFSDEMDVHSTLLQYALHDEAEKVIIYTKCQYKKLSKANEKFDSKIHFFDKIFYNQNGQLDFKSSIIFDTRYYTTEFSEKDPRIIDDKTLEFWKTPISKSTSLPKCMTNYKDVKLSQIKENKTSLLFASKAFLIHELGNPYLLLRKIRQAVYARLGIESIIEEVMEYNLNNNEYQFVPYLVKSDSTKEKELLSKTPLQIKQLIFHNIDKTSSVLFTEFNNHTCSILAEICALLSLVNQKDVFLDLFKQYTEKFKPIEKIILNKICYSCEKKFTMKESELEIYIIKELNYPSTCQNCINERAQERKIKEEMEKNLQTYMDQEDKKNQVEKEKEKEKEERNVIRKKNY